MALCLQHIHATLERKGCNFGVVGPELLRYASQSHNRRLFKPKFLDEFKTKWASSDVVVVPACDGIHWNLSLWFPKARRPHRGLLIETYPEAVLCTDHAQLNRLLQNPNRRLHPNKAGVPAVLAEALHTVGVQTPAELHAALVPHQDDDWICGLIMVYYLVAFERVWSDDWRRGGVPDELRAFVSCLLDHAVSTDPARAKELRICARDLLASAVGVPLDAEEEAGHALSSLFLVQVIAVLRCPAASTWPVSPPVRGGARESATEQTAQDRRATREARDFRRGAALLSVPLMSVAESTRLCRM
jgi:hypothetical protein